MWNLTAEARLAKWKQFRESLDDLPFSEAVQKTVNIWSFAPFVNHYLDRQDHRDWPMPWELLATNKYDDMAKALGMMYTLALTSHGKNHAFCISTVALNDGLDQRNVVLIDNGRYVLNYVFNEVVTNEQMGDIEVINSVSSEELQLSKY